MALLIFGIVSFLVVHLYASIRSKTGEGTLVAKIGRVPYMAIFSLLSIGSLAAIVVGFGQARLSDVTLYEPPVFLVHLNTVLMALTMILLVSAYSPVGYIKRTVKHPMLLAVKVWAFGHLLANGTSASLVLFIGFLAYGVTARIILKRKGDNGPAADVEVDVKGDVISVVVGLAVYALFLFWLHELVTGVPALPI